MININLLSGYCPRTKMGKKNKEIVNSRRFRGSAPNSIAVFLA